MLTNKGKYGLKAMLFLARLEPGSTAMGQEIATANNIPKKFLDAILLELRNAGMLRSKKGPGGGYALSRTPREIRIGHIIRVLDGPLAPLNCASKSAYVPCQDCEDLASCAVRITMSKVRDAMSDILDGMSLHDMVVFARVPDADLMYNI
ncbi:Rrf2 family transcriptional regulator [Ancylobacter dichloromethanicus]|uniref:Rrf2 family transcriptional regulator n=1 Tax=Ancylobacter dichloromethanicus TaxID=518825 RepID=A0A9W6J532_9HYPH|nr:Rrf2 family transcriptional regulator [Ancylobacter dichloromethanicus]MBS7556211.1 Rrf2 family transcriptional regulator [Ancylobacter dichloromethanicus]GLK69966.1 Rrf2 family transcriptional regulator [Ancylobacter dichloromethanicus]